MYHVLDYVRVVKYYKVVILLLSLGIVNSIFIYFLEILNVLSKNTNIQCMY